MEQVTVITASVAFFALLFSIWQTSRLAVLAIHRPGIGRVLFLSQASLKLWAGMVLVFFIVNTVFPNWNRGNETLRLVVRLTLGVYLVVQPIAVNIAVWRWKRRDDGTNN